MKLHQLHMGEGPFSFEWNHDRQPGAEWCLRVDHDEADGIPILHGDYDDFLRLLFLLERVGDIMRDCKVHRSLRHANEFEVDDGVPF